MNINEKWQEFLEKEEGIEKVFQKFSQRTTKEILRVDRKNLEELARFIWLKESGSEELKKELEISVEREREESREIFRKLRKVQNIEEEKAISKNLEDTLERLVVFLKEAEILRSQELERKILTMINLIIARGDSEFFKKLYEEIKVTFDQANQELELIFNKIIKK